MPLKRMLSRQATSPEGPPLPRKGAIFVVPGAAGALQVSPQRSYQLLLQRLLLPLLLLQVPEPLPGGWAAPPLLPRLLPALPRLQQLRQQLLLRQVLEPPQQLLQVLLQLRLFETVPQQDRKPLPRLLPMLPRRLPQLLQPSLPLQALEPQTYLLSLRRLLQPRPLQVLETLPQLMPALLLEPRLLLMRPG